MENIFENPKKYLPYLWKIKIKKNCRKSFEGKSMTTVWLTKLCKRIVRIVLVSHQKDMTKEKSKNINFPNLG